MNNTVLAGLIVGAVVVAAGSAIAVNSGFNPLQKYATVVAVEPAFDTNRVPRQVCGDEALTAQSTVPGSAPGGGPTAAVAGPPAGGVAADKPAVPAKPGADKPAQQGNTEPEPEGTGDAAAEGDCVMVYDTESVPAGFDVTYELDGVQRVVRMERKPGERIPVEDGELVLSQS
ncbi:MAG: glycine zipper 2TM domain-containing protein [Steroidobacteraceae bacterium]